jgi:YggT family protein
MLGLNDAVIFIIKTLGSLYLLIVLMRFILQVVRANFYNPLCQFIVKATQPLLQPLRRIIPSMFGLDMSSLVLALLIQMALIAIILTLKGFAVDWLFLIPWAMIALFSLFLNILFYAMIISIILSWVAPGSHNPGAELVTQITEPFLAPFRRILPNLGGLDISPIFAFILIQLLQSWVIPRLAYFAFMPQGLLGLI